MAITWTDYDNGETLVNIRTAENTFRNAVVTDVNANTTKLAGIEAGATADQSDAEIKTAYEANADTNALTDAEKAILVDFEDSVGAVTSETGILTLDDIVSLL